MKSLTRLSNYETFRNDSDAIYYNFLFQILFLPPLKKIATEIPTINFYEIFPRAPPGRKLNTKMAEVCHQICSNLIVVLQMEELKKSINEIGMQSSLKRELDDVVSVLVWVPS